MVEDGDGMEEDGTRGTAGRDSRMRKGVAGRLRHGSRGRAGREGEGGHRVFWPTSTSIPCPRLAPPSSPSARSEHGLHRPPHVLLFPHENVYPFFSTLSTCYPRSPLLAHIMSSHRSCPAAFNINARAPSPVDRTHRPSLGTSCATLEGRDYWLRRHEQAPSYLRRRISTRFPDFQDLHVRSCIMMQTIHRPLTLNSSSLDLRSLEWSTPQAPSNLQQSPSIRSAVIGGDDSAAS